MKSKKRSVFYLFMGFLFMVLLIQSFMVYTAILDSKYRNIQQNDSSNYLVLRKAVNQMDLDFIRAFNKTELVVSTTNLEISDFNYSHSYFQIDDDRYSFEDRSSFPKQTTFQYEFKEHYQFLTAFILKDYYEDFLLAGRYPNNTNEVLLTKNFLDFYGLNADDILYKNVTLRDELKILLNDIFIAGILDDSYLNLSEDVPFNLFGIITIFNQARLQNLLSNFSTFMSYYSTVYFTTYQDIMITVNAMKDNFSEYVIEYSGQMSADMVELLVRQSAFAQEMFKLIGTILILAMLISLMVSIIFRIRNQAIYISISHVYGMKKGSLYLSIYLELLVIYVLAVVSSTALAYGLFRVINNLFGPAFRISLIPTSLNLFTSFMFMVFMGVIIVSFYATIAIIMIKRYKPIAILRMSNRF
jgi:hypothetical protein